MKSIALTLIAVASLAPIAFASSEAKSGATVKIDLHATATVMPDDSGFFLLGDISDISGGSAELRDKLSKIEVGRAPLDSYVRHLNLGDVALKLRQNGINPNRDVDLTGAQDIAVSDAPHPVTVKTAASITTLPQAGGAAPAPEAAAVVIKKGDPITIVVQDGALTITAVGQSREDGAVGDTIHVHRNGVMTDLEAQVIDAHTVQLEM
jgi:hypothetical protein